MKSSIVILSLIFTVTFSISDGQERVPKNISAEFDQLLHYKREFEKYAIKSDKNKVHMTTRDSLYVLYLTKVESIKISPDVYLTYIEKALKRGSNDRMLTYSIPYDYYDPSLPFNPNLHLMRRLDFFRIIKESLFDRGEVALPQRTPAFQKAGVDTVATYKLIKL